MFEQQDWLDEPIIKHARYDICINMFNKEKINTTMVMK